MGLFGHRPRDSREGIVAFWSWWSRAKDEADAALVRGDLRKLHRKLTDRVALIHPEISWELTEGRRARHALVLSSEGSPALRPLTERWVRAGPGPDTTWEYYPARQPNPTAYRHEVEIAGRTFHPGAARFATQLDADRARVHVAVWHPTFPHLDDATRLHTAFLLLDWALGEDDVEQWLGEVRVAGDEPGESVQNLQAAVADLAVSFTGSEWTTVEGIDDRGRPIKARLKIPYPRLAHPLFDLHGVISVAFRPGPGGWPSEEEDAALEAMTSGLVGRLGAAAVLVAVVTAPGVRVLHLYADAEGVVPEQVAAWAAQQPYLVRPLWTSDPGWDAVRALYA